MPVLETPIVELGKAAPDFELLATDGKHYRLADVQGARGTLVMFICNHCPYVQRQIERIVADARALQDEGIGVVAIMPNDTDAYREDDYPHMQQFARQHDFSFPYLLDDTQRVAEAYGAVCTPDFFGYNANGLLQYRGRLDESWSQTLAAPKRELLMAMLEIAEKGHTTRMQYASMGCSIKWRLAGVKKQA